MDDKNPMFQMISQGIRQNNVNAEKKIENIRKLFLEKEIGLFG